jgi:hypothetical protein
VTIPLSFIFTHSHLTLPISPLFTTVTNNLTPKSLSLPPLKFRSSLLPPRNPAFRFDHHCDHDRDSITDNESVASMSCPAAETNVDDDEDEKVLDYLDTPNAVL